LPLAAFGLQAFQRVKRAMQHAATLRCPNWAWTMGSGDLTIVLALVAFLLPDIHWAPKGGIVAWLLVAAGAAELALAVARGLDRVGLTALGSGLLTAGAGLIFLFNPSAGYFPIVNVVTLWLVVRGAWVLAMAFTLPSRREAFWLGGSGAVDVALALLLAAGLPTSLLVVTLFGPTPALVARFSLVLAASFLATGIAQVAIALQRRGAGHRPNPQGC
jgi:uncharacterized membrane protein HdeD (DUF308 family)